MRVLGRDAKSVYLNLASEKEWFQWDDKQWHPSKTSPSGRFETM